MKFSTSSRRDSGNFVSFSHFSAVGTDTIATQSPLVNRSIVEANLRQKYGVIVVGIQRQDRSMEFNPEPDTVIRSGDKLVVLGRPDSLKKLEGEAAGQ